MRILFLLLPLLLGTESVPVTERPERPREEKEEEASTSSIPTSYDATTVVFAENEVEEIGDILPGGHEKLKMLSRLARHFGASPTSKFCGRFYDTIRDLIGT